MTAGIEFDPAERKAIAAEVNLSVLKRLDTSITCVVSSASHVALYELAEDVQQWRRCDVEGSLFVVERDVNHPNNPDAYKHRIVIINRKSLENYTDDIIVGNRDMEHTDQMIMYCNSKRVTVGIWFYQADEAQEIFNLLRKIVDGQPVKAPPPERIRAKRPSKRPAKATKQPPAVQRSAKNPSPPENPLERFFPDLKLTDGVAGEALSEDARDSAVFESDAVTSMTPGPALKPKNIFSSSTESHNTATNESQPPSSSGPGKAPISTAQTDVPSHKKPQDMGNSSLKELQNALSNPIPSVSAAKTTPHVSLQTRVSNAPDPKDASTAHGQTSVLPQPANGRGSTGTGVPMGNSIPVPSLGASAPGMAQSPMSPPLHTMGEAQRMVENLKLQQAHQMRAMQAYRMAGGDMNGTQRGGMLRTGIPPSAAGTNGPFGGVHPQMAMMMHHQQQHHMYMHMLQQHQMQMQGMGNSGSGVSPPVGNGLSTNGNAIGSNVGARQPPPPAAAVPAGVPPAGLGMGAMSGVPHVLTPPNLAASGTLRGPLAGGEPSQQPQPQPPQQSQQSRQSQPPQQSQQPQQSVLPPVSSTSSYAAAAEVAKSEPGSTPASGGVVAADKTSADALLRMLNVQRADKVPEKKAVDDLTVGQDIAAGVLSAQESGIVGAPGASSLDRTGFRAVLQRMLTDRKLFDQVYEHYASRKK